ncbi:hypothetical protein Pelo_5916 [Pelomyxa schiedti]|nr:hypothetical protein Pelo_5916 [Pelomyxa schiedti]
MAATEGTPATPSDMPKCVTEERYFGPPCPPTPTGGEPCALTISADMGVWTHEQALNLTWYHNSKNCSAEAFRLAASSWEAACAVKFVQVTDPSKALFDVIDATPQEEKAMPTTIAFAFFPRQAPPHHVVCFAKMLNEGTRNIAIAVVRHELGHVLGWRHEHMWDQTPESHSLYFPDSNGNWIRELPDSNCHQLTEYDRQSIMNYLKIWEDQKARIVTDLSENDKLGSRMMYPKSEPVSLPIMPIQPTTSEPDPIIVPFDSAPHSKS